MKYHEWKLTIVNEWEEKTGRSLGDFRNRFLNDEYLFQMILDSIQEDE